ncbi:MAG: hypothetical protein BGO37_10950 [Cellulomonas sp. 73-92]|nr:MAG: hypothetical protein BGO37_10950 [Cellulomonas sp. 73-92]
MPTVESLRPSGPLTFLQPGDADPTSPTSLPTEPAFQPDPSSSSSQPYDVESAPEFAAPPSSTGSSASAPTKRVIQENARKAVFMAGEGAHQLLSKDEFDEQVDLYRADADDAKSIGDPFGAIVHRHGLLGAAANPDVMDGINALVGLAVYGWKQFERVREARRLRKLQRAAEQAGTEQADDATDAGPSWPAR